MQTHVLDAFEVVKGSAPAARLAGHDALAYIRPLLIPKRCFGYRCFQYTKHPISVVGPLFKIALSKTKFETSLCSAAVDNNQRTGVVTLDQATFKRRCGANRHQYLCYPGPCTA